MVRVVIVSYRDKDTQAVAERRRVPALGEDIQRQVQRKLMILNAAVSLNDLRVPPGNRLEALSGDRAGQHSIRVNDRWRICFVWRDGNAHRVEMVDYH
ncbi:MAG: type II toxin-antitoxin system RelE/ParE family toxin [Acidimicrobiaceae bacterium]|nr:type II toxin-antitoxin system RelE/ParE family toxin [Acidimicrobiaceae bacterium]